MIEKNKIRNIILDYIEVDQMGQESLDEMVVKIKLAILNELDDAEHLDDARGYVKEYL